MTVDDMSKGGHLFGRMWKLGQTVKQTFGGASLVMDKSKLIKDVTRRGMDLHRSGFSFVKFSDA